MSYETLQLQTQNGIGIVWMNRPKVRNAFNGAMVAELTASFRALDADPAVRAIVLAGIGPAFCAGADLNWMKEMAEYSFAQNYEGALASARMLQTLANVSKPTVARVHGDAFAGGMGLIAACDIAIAAHGAEFCLSEVKLGLIPATIAPYVVAAMGERMAHRYFLSAERFDAPEAYRIGFVHDIVQMVELDAAINLLLGHLVAGGPAAHAATKELIGAVARAPLSEEMINDTATRIATARASTEGKEGMRAFLEKRPPSWTKAFTTGGAAKPKARRAPRKDSR